MRPALSFPIGPEFSMPHVFIRPFRIAACNSAVMTETGRHRLGVLLVAGAALWWSTGGIFIRSVHTDPWTTIFWRSISAAATMFLFIAIRKRAAVFAHFREIGWPGVIIALCFCGASTCYIPAVLLTSVANALILQSLSPFIAALLAFLLMGERVDLRTMVAMLVSVFGVYVMVAKSVGGGSYLGNGLGLAIGVFYAMAVVVTRYSRAVQMLPASCLAAVFATLLSYGVLFANHRLPWPILPLDLAWLTAFGALQMAGGMVMFTYGGAHDAGSRKRAAFHHRIRRRAHLGFLFLR